ncbi:cation diffusion facilitator transporter family protein [Ehrlichia ruminantium]|uniref:cation diffusion facilitator family transporter n=1 Tax=Ehrlichia ruminantium TaxID=779 RepID=UPI0007C1063A|nr:cation diffusion facilitator family transporter [Ehrlichia ruminantium]GAT79061.1 cation diffusion facilitator transporter family protein [Ehrlichia ruminantium]
MSLIHKDKPSCHENKLVYAIFIIIITMMIEVIGGIASNSLALLSDAGHMFTDFVSLLLSWLAYKVAMKKSDSWRSYGYHRFQVVAAFTNGLTLLGIALLIILESVKRFFAPEQVRWEIMISVAILGLIANIASFFLLYRKNESNLNIKSAVLHVIGDLLGSVTAIAASIIIMFTSWEVVDPLLSVLVSIIILGSAYKIIKNSGHILLEGTPDNINPSEIRDAIYKNIPEILDVHHIHIWSLTTDHPIMTMHVKLSEVTVTDSSEYSRILISVKKLISQRFGIIHVTIEAEYDSCADDSVMIETAHN